MINFINKNKKRIFVFILFLLIFGFINYIAPVGFLDEIWKYGNAKAIHMGYIPYKDVNMNTTPFYFFFEAFFLKFCDDLITFRIVSSFMWSFNFLLIFKILKKYFTDFYSLFFSLFLCIFTILFAKGIFIFDYNCFIFMYVLIISFILENKELNNKNSFFIGFLLALSILTKQTSGVLLAFFTFIFIFITKRNFKKFLFVGFFIPNFIFLIYLIYNNIFYDFWDYCLFGLIEFKDKNVITLYDLCVYSPINFLFLLIALFFCCFLFFKAYKNKKLLYVLEILYIFSLYLIACPISDFNHIVFFYIYSFLLIFTFIKNIFPKINNFFIKVFLFIYVVIILFVSIFIVYDTDNVVKKSNLNHFRNLYITETLDNFLTEFDLYVKNNYNKDNFLMLSPTSFYYSIINDENKGIYDLFFYGNIGTKNHVECVKEELDKGKIICISKYYNEENSHNSKEVYPYLKENATLIDSYYVYEFYQKIEGD